MALMCWRWKIEDLRLSHLPATHSFSDAAGAKTPRVAYRYSVVPGGVFSAEELRLSRRIDRVVAAHYVDFGVAPVMAALPRDSYLYVSFRRGDKVYWTSAKRLLHKGERVVSDGKHMGRARCGNRLSELPMSPTEQNDEPSEAELNLPELPFSSLPPGPPLADLAFPAPVSPLEDLIPLLEPTRMPFANILPASAGLLAQQLPNGPLLTGDGSGFGPASGVLRPGVVPILGLAGPPFPTPVPEPGRIGYGFVCLALAMWLIGREANRRRQ